MTLHPDFSYWTIDLAFAMPPDLADADVAELDEPVDRLMALPAAVVVITSGDHMQVRYCIDGGSMDDAFAAARCTAPEVLPDWELIHVGVTAGVLEDLDL